MSAKEALEEELKAFIIETLALEDISAGDIQTAAPLFGEGLGLDSLDALELGVALQKKYGIKIDADAEETKSYFASVSNLAKFITDKSANRQANHS